MRTNYFSIRRLRRLLWAASIGCIVITAALTWTMLAQDLPTANNAGEPTTATTHSLLEGHDAVTAITPNFSPDIYRKPLRLPLYDPPPVVVQAAPPPPPPPLRLKLLGTVVEPDPDQSSAIVMTGDGTVHMLKRHDTADDARVQAIHDGSIDLLYHNQPQTLTLTPGN